MRSTGSSLRSAVFLLLALVGIAAVSASAATGASEALGEGLEHARSLEQVDRRRATARGPGLLHRTIVHRGRHGFNSVQRARIQARTSARTRAA